MIPRYKQIEASIRCFAILATFGLVFVVASSGLSYADDDPVEEKITFDDHVGPLLRKRCSTCHNTAKMSSGLDITGYAALMEGGSSGSGIEPGDASGSYLFSLVSYEDGPEMPPGNKIPDAEIELIRKWIDGGALENKGSKAVVKPKFDMAISDSPLKRPEITPMPVRLSIEPALRTKKTTGVTAMATSPWVSLAAMASPGQILLYNTQNLQLIGVLPIEGVTHSLRFSRSGKVLVAGGGVDGARGTVTLWDVVNGEPIGTIGDELDTILAADISPDHSLVALGGPGKVVKVYSTADSTLQYEIRKHTDWITALEFSPDGKFLSTGDRNGGVHLWFTEDGSEHITLNGHQKMISELSWRSDGKVMATASEDTSIRIWETENGNQVKSWNSHAPGVTSLEFARDGSLVSGGRDKIVRIWQQDGKQKFQFGGLSDVVMSISYCDETKRVIGGDWTGNVLVWNESGQVGQLNANPPRLQERLAWNQEKLSIHQETLDPLLATFNELKAQLGTLTSALQQTREEQVSMEQVIAQLKSEMTNSKKQLESTVSEQQAWKQELEKKKAAKPLVIESHEKAKAALAALPEDEDLKDATLKLGKKVKSLDALTGELDALVQKSDQRKVATGARVKQATDSLTLKQHELYAIKTRVNELQMEIGSVNDLLVEHQAKVVAAQKLVDSSNQMVLKWQGEIDFVSQLAAVKQELRAAREAFSAKEAEAAAAQQALAEVEEQATYARNVKSEAQKKVEALHNRLRALQSTGNR